jgi:hypothetical protein
VERQARRRDPQKVLPAAKTIWNEPTEIYLFDSAADQDLNLVEMTTLGTSETWVDDVTRSARGGNSDMRAAVRRLSQKLRLV